MATILICPGERPGAGFLAQTVPLVALPILGESLLAHWLAHLATSGVKEVLVLATDRPELIRSAVGDGSRWGLRVSVRAELRELTLEEVWGQVQASGAAVRCESLADIILIDHLPGMEDFPLFESYRGWFTALLAWMPRAAKFSPIGLREILPQVWCGHRVHLAASARLQGPCWIGDYARVQPDAVIGPNTILEKGVVIDSAAEICSSIVGHDTFVGALTRLENSIALGNTLIDWRTGSCTQVPDSFLLCALGQRSASNWKIPGGGWWASRWRAVLTRPRALASHMQGRLLLKR